MVGSCGKKGLVWSVVKSGESTVDNWILQSCSYYVITTDHSGSLSVLSVKKANIITESRLFLFVYFHVLYSWEDSTPGTLSSLIHTLNKFDDATVSSLLLRKAENVSSVLLDDFDHFLGRFLRNFAEQFFKSGNLRANQVLKHSTFPRIYSLQSILARELFRCGFL